MLTQLRLLRDLTALVLVTSTWPLWTAQTDFPVIPFFSSLVAVPRYVDQTLAVVLVGALLLVVVSGAIRLVGHRSLPSVIQRLEIASDWLFPICAVCLILLNQHRLQVWMYHFLILVPVLWRRDVGPVPTGHVGQLPAAGDDERPVGTGPTEADIAVMVCVVAASIYGWSAWSKIDHSFIHSHGQTFVRAIVDMLGISTAFWSERTWQVLALSLPVGELLVAVLLLIRRFRRAGFLLAVAMHGLLLLAVGPWALNHSRGVILWNVFFITQNLLLFRFLKQSQNPTDISGSDSRSSSRELFKSRPCTCVFLAVVVLLPSLRSTLLPCDTWPAWAVYASSPARVLVQIRDDVVDKLPVPLKKYAEPRTALDGWSWYRIDLWSIDAVKTPIYPQDRFQLGAAAATSLLVDPESDHMQPPIEFNLRVIRETHSNRWTGERFQETFRFTHGWPGALGEAYLLNWKPRLRSRRP